MDCLTHYIIVRRDLPVGVIFANIAHAAGESFYAFACRGSSVKEHLALGQEVGGSSPSRGSIQNTILIDRTTAVILGSRNESRLLKLEKALDEAGIPHVAVREPDSPFYGALMAIGLLPTPRSSAIDAIVNEFHMFRTLDA